MAQMIASSPLAVSRPSSGGTYKRQVTARGAVGSFTGTRLSTSSSYNGHLLADASDRGLLDAASLYKHFSLSGSQRRSVASSPTEGREPGQKAAPAPKAVQVGFDVPSAFAVTSTVGFNAASERPAPKATGLLSRAFTPPVEVSLPHIPESTAFVGDHGPMFFPDVDTTLLRDCQERNTVFHTELVSNAYMLAAKAHAGQFRRDGTSLLSHCVMTALQLAEMGLDAECVAAGLLHEALRNSPAFRSQMEEFMPSGVVQLVDRVTTISEISQLYRNNRDTLNEEKMRRMLLAMEDVKAVLIKLACRVHNMKTISALPREKQVSFAQETLDIYSVVANRLGIWCLKAQLEDLAFSILHPEDYEALQAQVAKRQDPVALEQTIAKIKAGLDARGVSYEDISGRPKNLYGIWLKMKASGITDLDQVYDVTALRVVVTNKHDCYSALRVVEESYRTMPERSKDYIKESKKPNGYQSLHETVYGEGGLPVEVQIRTHKMHYIAEYGFAAHWKYKEKLSDEDEWLDKEVQYKKWLTTYKLGVHDKKVRPNGAPPSDCALKSLGMHLLDGSAGSMDDVDPFLRHDRFKLHVPSRQVVNVVVQTQDGIDTRQFPINYPAAQLLRELGVDSLPGYTLTVNQRIPAPNCVLQSGDLIQIVTLETVLSRSPPQQPAVPMARSTRLVFLPGSSNPVAVPLPATSAPQARAPLPPAPLPGSVRRRQSYGGPSILAGRH